MKNQMLLAVLVASVSGISSLAQADGPHPHCFAIAAPRVCAAGQYRITIQGRDCFHTDVTARVEVNGQVIATLANLQDRTEGAPVDGLAPWVVFSSRQDGFFLKTANGTGETVGSEFTLNLPRAERVNEQNFSCSY